MLRMRVRTQGMICLSDALKSPRRLSCLYKAVYHGISLSSSGDTSGKSMAQEPFLAAQRIGKGRMSLRPRRSRASCCDTFGPANAYVEQQGVTSPDFTRVSRPRCLGGLSPHLM